MRHPNLGHADDPLASRRQDTLVTRVPPLATWVRRRHRSLIPRLVRQLPGPLRLGLNVGIAATQRLRLGLVLPRQGAQFVPRAA